MDDKSQRKFDLFYAIFNFLNLYLLEIGKYLFFTIAGGFIIIYTWMKTTVPVWKALKVKKISLKKKNMDRYREI